MHLECQHFGNDLDDGDSREYSNEDILYDESADLYDEDEGNMHENDSTLDFKTALNNAKEDCEFFCDLCEFRTVKTYGVFIHKGK